MPVDGAAGPKDNSGAEEADETDGTKFPAVLDVTKEAATEAAGDVEDADEPGGGGEDPELEDVAAEEAGGRRAWKPARRAAAVFLAARVETLFNEFAAPPPLRFAEGLVRALESN